MNTPKVSVVLPVYNRTAFLDEAVESILKQTLPDFELIIVDDGSDDPRCLEMARGYEKADSRVRVMHQENGGPAVARNTAIAVARAPYIALMDDDDISEPARLEKQAMFLDQHPDLAAVACLLRFINQDGHVIDTPPAGPEIILGANGMYRTEALKSIGLFNPWFKCAEDLDLTLRLKEKYAVDLIPERLYRYRQHEKTQGSSVSTGHRVAYYQLACLLCALYRRQGKPEPISPSTHVRDLLPLFQDLSPEAVIRGVRHLPRKSKRLLLHKRYRELRTFIADMDTAFLGTQHEPYYLRIRNKTRRRLALKALQYGRWGWFFAR